MSLRKMVLAAALVTPMLACPPSPHGFDQQELLWPQEAPGATGTRRHDRPRLFFYYPDPAIATDTAIVIASGGSYGHHGGLWPEAEPTAKWLTAQGITAVVVRYRVGERGGYDHRAYMADGARAIQVVRSRAESLGIAPDKIGIIGYSAGGHLAASLATRCPKAGETTTATPIELPPDLLSQVSCRPDFAATVYPVITFDPDHVYERSRVNLLGDETNPSQELIDTLSVERQVTETTAPLFLVHSAKDTKVDPENSVLLHEALVAHGVPTELHMYPDGRHGVGLARNARRMPQMSQWPDQFLAWVRAQGKL